MSVDDYVKGKETKPCPISSDATEQIDYCLQTRTYQ
jgi:hypothetical protein